MTSDDTFRFGEPLGDARISELQLLSWIGQRGEVLLPPVARGPWRDLLIYLVASNLLTTFSYERTRSEAIDSGVVGSSPVMDSPSGIAGESLLERGTVKARVHAIDQLYSDAGGTFRITHEGRVRLSELKQALRSGREREPFGILWDGRHWERDLQVALVDASAETPVGFAFMDMNGLKVLNDQHNHNAGDRGLRMYFQAVASILGDDGQGYRIGGDEVLAILPHTATAATAKLLQGACRKLMNDSFESSPKILLSIAVGIVAATDPLKSPAALRTSADEAQKRAKTASKNQSPRPSVIAVDGVDELIVMRP